MSILTTILGTDRATDSRAVINANFSTLNTDKKEVGMTLSAVSGSTDPLDATTYYWGSAYSTGANTSSNWGRFYIPKSGTIKTIYVNVYVGGTLATTETSTISFRLNGTTDTTVSSSVQANAVNQVYSATVSIAVVAGDYFQMKWVTPTWTTNPTTVRLSAQIYME